MELIDQIKKAYKQKDGKPYPEYVYDRIEDLSYAHSVKPVKTFIEVIGFGNNFTPMLTITAQRSIAQRAGWAGNDAVTWSDTTVELKIKTSSNCPGKLKTFPEWGCMTVYKMVQGQKVAFVGPKLKAIETVRTNIPMWFDKGEFMFEKNIEAAALRRAFPEVLAEDAYIPEEGYIPSVETDKGVLDTLASVKADNATPAVKTPVEMHIELKPEPVEETKNPVLEEQPITKVAIAATEVFDGSTIIKEKMTDESLDTWIEQIKSCTTEPEFRDIQEIIKSSYELTAEQKKRINTVSKEKLAEVKNASKANI